MTQLLAPDALISQVTIALDELREQVRGVDFQNYAKASSLPGWSTAQLIAHLASFAKAARRQFERAGQEPLLEMYDGGAAGRIEAINMTALMRPEALLELTNTALAELREVLPSAAGAWEEPVGYRPGAKVADMMYATWREMLIHATDLDEFVRPASSWPAEFSEHLFRALAARVPSGDRLVLQPHGKPPVVLGAGENSWVLSGTEFDLAAWLAGRPAAGPVQATAAADAADYPELLPWPSDRLMNR
ncbi:maleylpyruvate isomerase family mycothiol-dependent enzyme [Glutamicibacter protophormiae]|uniref:maleylpyruvate isomerase family mycothiol-dependent enzyme n=1 Tax=Glutamicibacter protophormiae TaxID=37930 RepID=UPI002A82742E|nr:maleylpyruvate isomerase family mycothiol-dependent enzyme [Glutamicibacter protophormiae]WPR65868.1 maleylpyruvate isomerase family mycothiol-dependent enzyme [Glutamicibacter protophormiae]WPR69366.1 maleylpyruvate isomerase family mycothiol-dependent enzyme [Glutamicibacter protophormiae]